MSTHRTIDSLIKAHTDIRRHVGLRLFTLSMQVCPEIKSVLQQEAIQLARVVAARRYQAFIAEHQRALARHAARN